jgi:hypothetical protein
MHSKTIHIFCLFLMLACPAWGQDEPKVQSEVQPEVQPEVKTDPYKDYQELLMMVSDTAVSKPQFYDYALACCRKYTTLLHATSSDLEGYNKLKLVMKSLYSFVRSGAGYYSQQGQDSIALIQAQTAVDVAMLKEMADQGIRSMPDYPNYVLFVASRIFNARRYEEAVKYLTEYINVTDASLHPRVLVYLNEAESIVAQQRKTKGIRTDVNKDAPDFDLFARESIRRGMDKWKQKDPYETVAEYKARVNEENARAKQLELQKILMDEYVQRFACQIDINDLQLKPYDADNQSFLIGSPYGDIVLVVPRTNDEARDFAENWAGIKVYNQQFAIANHKLALAGLTFSTPMGKVYQYDNSKALAYNETQIDANFKDLVDYSRLVNSDDNAQNTVITQQEIAVGVPDVDINIPEYKRVNDKTFAFIIANEKYTQVAPVPMAGNDGRVFAQYCEKTLGLPKENIILYTDATYGKMIRAVQDIKNIDKAYDQIRVIFYYAGHGVPNEKTRDAFLLPIDADGTHTEVCYPLKRLYSELSSLQASSVVVFLDACFSGSLSDGSSLLGAARSLGLKARQATPEGKMVVLSAASGDETAYPYADHGHGLFTYFLLKKLQISKGSVNLGDLSSYIIENVKQKSVLINRKIQTPTVSYPAAIQSSWAKMKLR